jgi:hypothetical protein
MIELGVGDQQQRFLIHDRDAKFPRAFDTLLANDESRDRDGSVVLEGDRG